MTTLGIDVATSQAGISFAGLPHQFVFVKAGGANVGLYTAPHYGEQIDAAMKAGKRRGHYWLTGKAGTPSQQAQWFVSHLHAFDPAHDGLALDNEVFLNEPGSRSFTDQECASFWRAVFQLLPHFPHEHAYGYSGAAFLREHGTWPACNALGIRWWVAGYGRDDGHDYGLNPIPGITPAIHQYTSTAHVAGYTVDLNSSDHSVDTLFGIIADPKPGRTFATLRTGVPNSVFWRRLVWVANPAGYKTFDTLGTGQIVTIQKWLHRSWGLTTPYVVGTLDKPTKTALQRVAKAGGYAGPLDGDPQTLSYRALAKYVNGQ